VPRLTVLGVKFNGHDHNLFRPAVFRRATARTPQGGRLPLLVDAFLRQAGGVLPWPHASAPALALFEHVWHYARELQDEFGRVMRAVLAECMAEQGSTTLLVDRNLAIRRDRVGALICDAQQAGHVGGSESCHIDGH